VGMGCLHTTNVAVDVPVMYYLQWYRVNVRSIRRSYAPGMSARGFV